ncbi:hypothetical protein ACOBQJ_05565 [Pelotomaculum propionicicum]|uniref:hypothetical protein n=1 Tax=Pelotomaculum propionicicum TaxID=258475 RepID=UPI003B7AEAF9
MRFIYLSTTKEKGDLETIEKAVKYFEAFIKEPEKHFNFKSKISRKNFRPDEDIFFLKTARIEGKNTFIVVAYARSATAVLEQPEKGYGYPYCFKLASNSLKIFPDGIDIEYFNSFIYEKKIRGITKRDFFTSNISDGKYIGSPAWRYFNEEDSDLIMNWFKDFLFDHTVYFLSEEKKFCNQTNNLFCGAL